MLNRRQIEILLELCENPGSYLTATYFTAKQQVSLRTIQSDVKAIKSELSSCDFMEFQSTPPKGSRIQVLNEVEFVSYKEKLYQEFTTSSQSYQDERVHKLLFLLLTQHRSLTYFNVENTLYISRSTLLNDLKRADAILQKYNLEIMRGSNKIVIDGSEICKRRCLTGENLLLSNVDPTVSATLQSKIKDILVETLVDFKYNVSEVDLNNMIMMLTIMIKRMENWFFISSEELEISMDMHPERDIAEALFTRLSEAFHLRIPEAEIDYFTLYVKGRGNLLAPAFISDEVDELVLDALREIRRAFGVDLTNDVNFRISLGLHCTPMLIRLKYNMQMGNQLVSYIRQNFPQSFDMAAHFGSFLQKRYGERVLDEEVAFLAIHIHKALTDLERSSGTRRILVISSMRRSENALIRQTLYKWFSDQIAELFFLPPNLMNESYLDKFDTFLTTEKGKYYDNGLAMYISPFPTQHDYLNLKLAMDGFESINDIMQIFHRDLFNVFHGANSRDDVLSYQCKKATKYFELKGLHEAVMEREMLRSTFLGNGMAAPHPIFAITADTFISVGIAPNPIDWDAEGNKVQLILLINVGKNNSKAFHIWNYLSKIFADHEFVAKLLQNPCYEHFLKLMTETISGDFNHP